MVISRDTLPRHRSEKTSARRSTTGCSPAARQRDELHGKVPLSTFLGRPSCYKHNRVLILAAAVRYCSRWAKRKTAPGPEQAVLLEPGTRPKRQKRSWKRRGSPAPPA